MPSLTVIGSFYIFTGLFVVVYWLAVARWSPRWLTALPMVLIGGTFICIQYGWLGMEDPLVRTSTFRWLIPLLPFSILLDTSVSWFLRKKAG